MRLFFAVRLPDEIILRVGMAQERFRSVADDPGMRWTKPEQFHFTIKFVGEVGPARAGAVVEAARTVAYRHQAFDIEVGGLGAFPSHQRPSAIWIGASPNPSGMEALASLAGDLNETLGKLGVPREARALQPHITLARTKTYAAEAAAVRALRRLADDDSIAVLGSATITGFTLYQSTLKPQGSQYEIIEEFQLDG